MFFGLFDQRDLFGNTFFNKAFMNGFVYQRVDDGEDRNAEEHTEDTEQTAHKNDRKHDPYTADSDTVTEDGRSQNVTIDLLNHQNDG